MESKTDLLKSGLISSKNAGCRAMAVTHIVDFKYLGDNYINYISYPFFYILYFIISNSYHCWFLIFGIYAISIGSTLRYLVLLNATLRYLVLFFFCNILFCKCDQVRINEQRYLKEVGNGKKKSSYKERKNISKCSDHTSIGFHHDSFSRGPRNWCLTARARLNSLWVSTHWNLKEIR